jgi:hypothetical protein
VEFSAALTELGIQILDQEHVSPDLIFFFINLFIFCLN